VRADGGTRNGTHTAANGSASRRPNARDSANYGTGTGTDGAAGQGARTGGIAASGEAKSCHGKQNCGGDVSGHVYLLDDSVFLINLDMGWKIWRGKGWNEALPQC
jgi:hypothetical protein